MNKTHSHSWTLHLWSGGAWGNHVTLRSHQSAVCRHLHAKPWKTGIPRGKKRSPTFKIQNVIRWTSRRSVGNPGISYSNLLILIPGSRVIFTWSLFTLFILRRSRPLSMTVLWHHGFRLLSLIYGAILAPYDIIITIHLIGQWPLSLLSIIRAVYLIIAHCVENPSHMGFIFSSLHKHDLISVVEYCSFPLVTTL